MIIFPIVLFLLSFPDFQNAHSCHKCASGNAVWNWVKYGLPVNEGDSVISDDNCLVESKLKKDGDKCSGICYTVNITSLEAENTGKTIAIVRECSKRHIAIRENEIVCESLTKYVNRKNVNITTCYCLGHYCNGVGAADAQQKNSIILPPKTTTQLPVDTSFPWFIVHISCIILLVAFLVFLHACKTCHCCCFKRKHVPIE
ncbi:unnamed protein product [Caenorhabditis angaria]|uniref:Protein quiver n=1 Tax=Caenorhabditis angaria TaxID=860376 RepID=A0A9P1IXD8_9PELO|nr:unnamed protein product [Caenorhabditis angaria]